MIVGLATYSYIIASAAIECSIGKLARYVANPFIVF